MYSIDLCIPQMECDNTDLIILRLENQDLEDKDLIQPSLLKKQISRLSIPVIYLCARNKVHAHNCAISLLQPRQKNLVISL